MYVFIYIDYRKFHRGVKATKGASDRMFPGLAIPLRIIAKLIELCPTCQKKRLTYGYSLPIEIVI
jgi:hypothetical protein